VLKYFYANMSCDYVQNGGIFMTGLEKNTLRLFSNKGKVFICALDHPQFFGSMPGLEEPISKIKELNNGDVDGFILNPGIFKLIEAKGIFRKKLIMRISVGGSRFSNPSDFNPIPFSPKTAIGLGADAVIIMVIIGKNDVLSIENAAKVIESYHEFSIPVITEILAADWEKTNDFETVCTGARICAEIGADCVKLFFTEKLDEIVHSCPAPVILAGGPKNLDVIEIAKRSVNAGVKGFAFGRNIFQAENPAEITAELNSVLRG
jgi:class I fructose-bisphosphate aldolase/fructose-bisphosphate aldolase/2-amino-3,7-dideoxy-D-threo-hept-6-ulosonate synthase